MPSTTTVLKFLTAFALATVLVPIATAAQQGHAPSTPVAAGEAVVTPLDLDGTAVTLSPDGQWIAGTGTDNQFCIWEVATLEPACKDEEMPIHADAMTWSPDSSKVAWSLDATRLGYESDIYVFDRTNGEMTNLTDDGIVGGLMSSDVTDTGSVPLDLFPTWSGDSQTLTFARSTIGPDAIPSTSLMTIDVAGGEPELLAVVYQERLAIWTPMVRTSDGALLYSVLPIDMGRKESGIWQLADGGDPEMLLEGSENTDYPMPALMDMIEIDGSVRITGYSTVVASTSMLDQPSSFVMDLASGETTPITFPGDETVALGAAGFSPDGTALAAITLGEGEPALVVIGNDGQAQEIPLGEPVNAAVGSGALFRAPEWAANNTILVAGNLPGQYLVTLPASGSATPDDGFTVATPCSCTPPPEQD